MQSRGTTQFTVRRVPERVAETLRNRAQRARVSLNRLLLGVLNAAADVTEEEVVHHDLDDLAGLWVDDPDFDEAIRAQHQVDMHLWK